MLLLLIGAPAVLLGIVVKNVPLLVAVIFSTVAVVTVGSTALAQFQTSTIRFDADHLTVRRGTTLLSTPTPDILKFEMRRFLVDGFLSFSVCAIDRQANATKILNDVSAEDAGYLLVELRTRLVALRGATTEEDNAS